MKLDLADMISLLEINHLPYINAIRHIFSLSKNNNFPLYFNNYKQLFAVKCNDVHISNYDNSGIEGYDYGWSGYGCIEPVNFEVSLPQLKINEEHELKWKIWNYFIGDDQYLFIDENSIAVVPVEISDMDIYCDKEELIASGLLDLQSSIDASTDEMILLSRTSNTPKLYEKKPSKVEKQVTAFKKWLINTSNKDRSDLDHYSDEDFYQLCYRDIGRPTREEVWVELVKFAPDYFDTKISDSIKKQNFFNRSKGGQSIVSFEGNEG